MQKGAGAEEEIFFVVAGALPVEVLCFYMRLRPTPFCLCDSLCVSIGMCVCVCACVCMYVCAWFDHVSAEYFLPQSHTRCSLKCPPAEYFILESHTSGGRNSQKTGFQICRMFIEKKRQKSQPLNIH
jgi:hypothetical protein